MANFEHEPMMELYLFETNQMLVDLENLILEGEKSGSLDNSINEIFRIMHTIKGSSAMMLINSIAELAHKVEDLFSFFREKKPQGVDHSQISDLVLEAIDFFKRELEKIHNGETADGKADHLIETVQKLLANLEGENPGKKAKKPVVKEKQQFYIPRNRGSLEGQGTHYQAIVEFTSDCDMPDVRALSVITNMKKITTAMQHEPADLLDNEAGIEALKDQGLMIDFFTEVSQAEVDALLQQTPFLKALQLTELTEEAATKVETAEATVQAVTDETHPAEEDHEKKDLSNANNPNNANNANNAKQTLISVNLTKLDLLMDLVGELVIAEAMVTRHPELEGLQLDNFNKAALQLRKLTKELQDVVMSVRMVPLTATFQKMTRIVRDMNRSLGKEVQLQISGAETEVDKNIIENISDPLMHLIRNSLDHGIETVEERVAKGKSGTGTVYLDARNSGGDVLITIRDDGRGLNRDKIVEKAQRLGMLKKPEQEMTDKEIYSLILLPGFSTKDQVTEYSGRGVGMDVVVKGIEKLGGKVLIDSVPNQGSVITLKIPLTLAIIDGMTIRVGESLYTVPTTSIRESFRLQEEELIVDSEGNEMILNRGKCYPVIRLHQRFEVNTNVTRMEQGITMMVENNESAFCLFADELLGEQQVVVKALPNYIRKVKGIAGCTLLGNGDISLILDVAGLEAC